MSKLPRLCIECGREVKGEPLREQHYVEDLTEPFFSPIFGLMIGFAVFLYWRWWAMPAGLLLGFFFGYRRHKTIDVRMELFRCKKHAKSSKYPHFRTFRDELIIGVGNKEVKQQFRHEKYADKRDPGLTHGGLGDEISICRLHPAGDNHPHGRGSARYGRGGGGKIEVESSWEFR